MSTGRGPRVMTGRVKAHVQITLVRAAGKYLRGRPLLLRARLAAAAAQQKDNNLRLHASSRIRMLVGFAS